jgi:hypothetical protein
MPNGMYHRAELPIFLTASSSTRVRERCFKFIYQDGQSDCEIPGQHPVL